jgi:hypothetical protein
MIQAKCHRERTTLPQASNDGQSVEQSTERTAVNGKDHAPLRRSWRERISQLKLWYARLSRVWKWIGGAVAFLGTLLALLSYPFPGLQPAPPSLEATATVSNPEVISTATLGEYLQQVDMPNKDSVNLASRVSDEQRQRLGSIIRFDVELKGFEDRVCYLTWSIYDADTRQPISGLTQQPAWPTARLVAQHRVSKSERETWVPFPEHSRGPFLVRLELYTTIEEQEVILDSTEVTLGT